MSGHLPRPHRHPSWKSFSIVIALLLLVIAASQHFIVQYFERQISREMRLRATEIADGLINGLNMLMVTGQIANPENRLLLLNKMSDSKDLIELRIIRAPQVQQQFGRGLPSEQATDEYDRQAIESRQPVYVGSELADGSRQFRAVIPFIASRNFRGTDCLSCHHVQEGSVNGAASITLDMGYVNTKLAEVKRWVWVGDVLLALLLALVFVWRRFDKRIQILANFDTVTGLPNRNLLQDRLAQAMSNAHRHDSSAGLLFIDLDDFKNVNDSLGHQAGDQLLLQLAGRLSTCIRESDTVARLGGDEFVVVANDLSHPDSLMFVAEKIIDTLQQPFLIEGCELFVSASIGIAVYPRDGEDQATLMRNADSAMYHAKEHGKGSYRFYAAEMNRTAGERLALVSDLHLALQRGEFELHYQPQKELGSGRIIGVEALVRWRHPRLGMVSPAHFIPIAEETRLILPLGRWIMQTACAQAAAWHRQGLEITVAINLSAMQIDDQLLIELVDDALRSTSMAPDRLELEITESMLIRHPEAIRSTFQKLRARGIRLAIDDFGTGYSSLSYLKQLPIDKLKIDRSFVQDIASDSDSLSIVEAVISIAHSLRLKAIAEGVETPEQEEMLRRLDCDEIQGHLFSRALATAETTALLTSRRVTA